MTLFLDHDSRSLSLSMYLSREHEPLPQLCALDGRPASQDGTGQTTADVVTSLCQPGSWTLLTNSSIHLIHSVLLRTLS